MKRKAPLFSRPGKRLTQSDSGSVLIYTVIASLIVASLSITYFSSTMINSRIAFDRQQKKKSLYAADGQMTLLAQECYDGHQYRYGVSSEEDKSWPGEYKFEAVHSGKILNVENGAVSAANVNQSTWIAQDHQKWLIVSVGKNQFRIVNKKSGYCLDVAGNSTEENANISQCAVKTVGSMNNQRWYLVDVGADLYKVESVNSYKVMEVDSGAGYLNDGQNVQQKTYTSGGHQKWRIIKVADEGTVSPPVEYFRIRNKWLPTKYLRDTIAQDIVQYGSYAAGDMSSHWKMVQDTFGYIRIINRLTLEPMHVENDLAWVQCSNGNAAWYSNHWERNPQSVGFYYIENRLRNNRINIFNKKGYAQNSNDFPGVNVQEYRITSSASNPERDPKDWLFKGSRDGVTWHTINAQSGQTFASRGLTKIYTFANDSLFNYYRLDITASNGAQTNMFFEAENLYYISSSSDYGVESNSEHSNGKAVIVSPSIGQYVEFTLPNIPAGTYGITVYTKDKNNRGKAQARLNNTTDIGVVQDFYQSISTAQVPHLLGIHTWPNQGDKKLKLTVTGKNTASSDYKMCIDYITLLSIATSSSVSLAEFKIIPTNGYTGFTGDSITAQGDTVGATKEMAFDGLNSTSWRDVIAPTWIQYQFVRPAATPWAEWAFESLPADTARLPDGVYKLISSLSGMVWDVQEASISENAKLVQTTYQDQANQKFQLTYLGGSMYKITNVKSGLAVSVTGSSAQINASLQQAPYTNTADQKWSFVSILEGNFKIYSQLSSFYNVCQRGSITEGTLITIDTGSSPLADSLFWKPVRVNTAEEISARGEKGAYPRENAFDREVTTKWVDTNVTWIQYKFISPVAVLGYSITSANDSSSRDPRNWTVRGSNDGSTWTTLDTKTNQSFASRYQTRTYTLANTMEYSYYQLNITANHGAPYTQLAELLFATITSSDGLGIDTVGNCNVTWQIKQSGRNRYTLKTEATILNATTSRNFFKTPLTQYLEVSGGGLELLYGPHVAIPVTYYDFHSDRTCPEFEQPNEGGGQFNMVALKLGPDRKPTLGPVPYLNYYIQYWFRESSLIPTSVVINLYEDTRSHEECGPTEDQVPGAPNVSYGTRLAYQAFENVKFQDVLVFTHLGNGMYEYKDDYFFPLDNKGLGNEWHKDVCWGLSRDHNYAFTMELHQTFTYTEVGGQTFWFCGDDDVWLYVNDTLVLDVGGIHSPKTKSVNIDTLDLVDNVEYPVDFFFAERHSIGSHIWIQTNMFVYTTPTKARRHWKRDYGLLD